jgi:glucosamine--fructose-6-phosphate aminotransferase (isomerizing)
MGGSLYAALPMVCHRARLGTAVQLLETGELVRHQLPLCRNATVILVSRSGETIEIVQLLDDLVGLGATTVGVTNEPVGACQAGRVRG